MTMLPKLCTKPVKHIEEDSSDATSSNVGDDDNCATIPDSPTISQEKLMLWMELLKEIQSSQAKLIGIIADHTTKI